MILRKLEAYATFATQKVWVENALATFYNSTSPRGQTRYPQSTNNPHDKPMVFESRTPCAADHSGFTAKTRLMSNTNPHPQNQIRTETWASIPSRTVQVLQTHPLANKSLDHWQQANGAENPG